MKTNELGAISILALSAAMAVSPASAQGAATAEGVQDEAIVVTARRMTETLQDVPAAVSVLSGATLERAGVQNLSDVSKLVPNFNFLPNYRQGLFSISVRGIGTVQGGEAPVAVLVDGIQAPGLDFINQDLLELASIEVMRGPQGALYGRGAIGGAVLINTVQPGDEWKDHLTLGYGNGRSVRALNSVSGPLSDTIGFTLTSGYRYMRGLINDTGLGRPADHSRQGAARLSLVFKPDEATRIVLTGSISQGRDGASYVAPNINAAIDPSLRPSRNLDTTDRRNIKSVSLKIEREVDFGTITSISQYARSSSRVLGDADWSPAAIARQQNDITVSAFNQDVRLSSKQDGPIRWMVGAFYQHRRSHDFLFVDGDPAGFLAGFTLAQGDNHSRSQAYAAYSQVDADIAAGLKLTGALRYDVDERRDRDFLVAGSLVSGKFSSLQPQGTLSYTFSPDVHGYVTVGRGFRSGGFNPYGDTLAIPGIPRRYDKEVTTNYEAGFKTQFFDRALTVNGAIFHTRFDNQQVSRFNASPPARDIVNIDSKTDGGELEVRIIPVKGFTLTSALGVNRARITSPAFKGKKSPNSYTSTLQIGGEYFMPVGGAWDAVARVDYSRNGSIYYDPANTARFGPTEFVNASLRLENDHLAVSVWGKNIFGEKAPAIFTPDAFGPGLGTVQPIQPATYGVELSARF